MLALELGAGAVTGGVGTAVMWANRAKKANDALSAVKGEEDKNILDLDSDNIEKDINKICEEFEGGVESDSCKKYRKCVHIERQAQVKKGLKSRGKKNAKKQTKTAMDHGLENLRKFMKNTDSCPPYIYKIIKELVDRKTIKKDDLLKIINSNSLNLNSNTMKSILKLGPNISSEQLLKLLNSSKSSELNKLLNPTTSSGIQRNKLKIPSNLPNVPNKLIYDKSNFDPGSIFDKQQLKSSVVLP